MTNQASSILNADELALLLAPIGSEREGAVFRIVNTGIAFGSLPPNTEVMSCVDLNALLLLLLQDSDFDALILGGFPLEPEEMQRLEPLLARLSQIHLFILDPSGESKISKVLPNTVYCQDIETLNSNLHEWHQTLYQGYRDWLKTINFSASVSHCNRWESVVFSVGAKQLVPIEELAEHSVTVALLSVSDENPNLVQELKTLAQHDSQLPIILVNHHSAYIEQTCLGYCARLGLPVLATLNEAAIGNALRNLVLHYYRRHRRKNQSFGSSINPDGRDVYPLSSEKPFGLFDWPDQPVVPKSYFISWTELCGQELEVGLLQAVEELKQQHGLKYDQLTIVFDGEPPARPLQEPLFELLIKSVNTCWLPRNMRMLMDSRKLFEMTHILIPINIWLELISDESFYLLWLRRQERISHRNIKVGLMGVSHKLSPQLSTLGFDFIVP